jgi:energy-coupling factor transporter ATP-binding protein EcfA2
MIDATTRRSVEAALDRFLAGLQSPRATTHSPDDLALLNAAAERVRAQLLGPSEPVLAIVLAGGTGVGKSTLINALAGQVIAEASEIRPTTRHIQVYHHRDDTLGNLPDALAGEATFVPHDRPELHFKMIVDAPDLDSFVVRHRVTTKTLLKRAGLVLYVFSPERYLEERTWSVVREETEFSACAAVLNKVDRVGSAEELEQITDDLRARFAGLGLGEIRIFRVTARSHVPDQGGVLQPLNPVVDDMVALQAFIERELEASEIARMLREQRVLVVAHLKAEVDRVAPESIGTRLDEVAAVASGRADAAAVRLAESLAEPLAAIEAELAPLMTLRRHERFWGPFRAWLAITDFIGFGLTTLGRRLLGRTSSDRMTVIERILSRGGSRDFDELLRAESYRLQDAIYTRGLPVERWRVVATGADGGRLVAELAAEIQAHFEITSAHLSRARQTVVWTASTLGGFIPSAFVLIGLFVMTRDVLRGNYAGFPLLWHLLAMMVLFFLALQGLIGAVLPGGTRWLGQGMGPQSLHKVLARTFQGWVSAYRADIETDLANLREPVAALSAVVGERPPALPGRAEAASEI